MQVFVEGTAELRFDDGTPVTAASGVAPLGDGWLVVSDDATIGAWRRGDSVLPVRLLPPVQGLDRFGSADGTKHLKPDLEVACAVGVDGAPAVLALGSGSSPRRMQGVLVRLAAGAPVTAAADLTPLYRRVAEALGAAPGHLNLEGGSRHGDTVRWFQRGNLAAGVPSASVDLPLDALVAALLGEVAAAAVPIGGVQRYALGEVGGVGLAVTDAVALPDGRTLLSAAAEDTPNAVDDGPVVATALALLDGDRVLDVVPLPRAGGRVHKVEGLALRSVAAGEARLVAVVDGDDPAVPSTELDLRVLLG